MNIFSLRVGTRLLVAALLAMFGASVARAGEVTFSGRTWITQEGVHRDNPGIPIEYQVTDDETVKVLGVFGSDAGVLTPVSLAVGDTISYDFQFTKDMIDLIGDGASDFIDDAATGFLLNQEHVGYQPAGVRVLFFNNPSELWFWATDPSFFGATPVETGIHVQWTIDSETDYSIKVWNTGSESPFAEFAGAWNNGATIADIQAFRAGLWNTEQTVTFSNFLITSAPIGVTGDTDDDGDVDLDDLNNVRNNFGGAGVGDTDADLDVDLDDLNNVRNNFGAAAPVPEPAGMAMLAVGAMAFGWYAQRRSVRYSPREDSLA